MATDKRERQRANREQKKAEEEKRARRKHRIDQIKKYGAYAGIFIASIIVLRFFAG